MAGDGDDSFMLEEDRSRLPWLEPAEPIEDVQPVSMQKVAALVLLGLVLLGVIIGGGWWLKDRSASNASSDAALISPPEKDYKIKADSEEAKKYDVDGMEVPGTGDAVFNASAGSAASGRIDPSKAPERPMTEAVKAKPAPTPPAQKPAMAAPTAPAPAPAPTEAIGGARVQLGAYDSKAISEAAWSRLVKRFEELAQAKHSVEPVQTGGRTLYRLRMGAADKAAAGALCGRLRVAGEDCFVVP